MMSDLPDLPEEYMGRDDDEEKILQVVKNNDAVVITGCPGHGKTTVGAAVGRKLLEEGYSVLFLSLREISSQHNLFTRAFNQLNVGSNREGNMLEQLCTAIKMHKSNVLLLFDNTEDALENDDLEFLDILGKLTTATKAKCLITSREQISLPRKIVSYYEIKELSTDHASLLLQKLTKDLTDDDARRLAEAFGSSPLALHLVAALLRSGLDVDTIVKDMSNFVSSKPRAVHLPKDDRVDYCISKSFERLQQQEKDVFVRMSVFPYTFDVDDLAATMPNMELKRLKWILASLNTRSMCSRNENTGRYSVHLLLKAFGKQKLSKSQKYDLNVSFRSHFQNKIENLAAKYHSKQSYKAMALFDVDKPNIELALQFILKETNFTEDFPLGTRSVLKFLKKMVDRKQFKLLCKHMAEHGHKSQQHLYLYSLAHLALAEENARVALEYMEEAKSLIQSKEKSVEFAYCQAFYSLAMCIKGEREKARDLAKGIVIPPVDDSTKVEDIIRILDCHETLIHVYDELEDKESALAQGLQAKTILDTRRDVAEEYPVTDFKQMLLTLTYNYIELDQVEDASRTLDEAKGLGPDNRGPDGLQEAIGDIIDVLYLEARILISNKEFEEAKCKCDEGMKIIEQYELRETLDHRNMLQIMAMINDGMNRFEESERVYDQLSKIYKDKGMPHDSIKNKIQLGNSLQQQSLSLNQWDCCDAAIPENTTKLDQAIVVYEECLAEAIEMDDKDAMRRCYKSLSEAFKQKGDDVKSAEYDDKIQQMQSLQPDC